mgnify:CR=1 FL=1
MPSRRPAIHVSGLRRGRAPCGRDVPAGPRREGRRARVEPPRPRRRASPPRFRRGARLEFPGWPGRSRSLWRSSRSRAERRRLRPSRSSWCRECSSLSCRYSSRRGRSVCSSRAQALRQVAHSRALRSPTVSPGTPSEEGCRRDRLSSRCRQDGWEVWPGRRSTSDSRRARCSPTRAVIPFSSWAPATRESSHPVRRASRVSSRSPTSRPRPEASPARWGTSRARKPPPTSRSV